VEGAELELVQLQQLSDQNQQKLSEWQQTQSELFSQIEQIASKKSDSEGLQNLSSRQWKLLAEVLNEEERQHLMKIRRIWERQRGLNRQMDQLATTRRLLAVWHAVHIPLGVAMFTVAFIHIGATLYYATLLR
jgi:hypothetical protein